MYGNSPYGGYRRNVAYRLTPVNTAIIIANVLAFLVTELLGSTHSTLWMLKCGANFWPLTFYGHEFYRLISSAFLHFGFMHLFSNMLILTFIGDNLEKALGKVKYALFYLLCAVGSGAASAAFAMFMGHKVVSAGASGAIFGVAGGILYVLIVNRGQLEDLSSFQITMFILFTLYRGLQSSGVDNVAHLSGVVIGFLLAMVFYHKEKRVQWRVS